MPITTNKIEERLFKVWMNESLIAEFEQWVYQSEELKEYLSADAYFDFLDLNYKSETAYQDLKNLISKEISISQLETWSLLHQLDCVKQRKGDYYKFIENFYNLDYYGYTFMSKLAYDYSFHMNYPFGKYGTYDFNELTTFKQNQLINEFYPSIIEAVNEVEQWLLNENVILLGGKKYFNDLKFIDHRAPSETKKNHIEKAEKKVVEILEMKKFVLKYSFMFLGAVLMFVLNYSWLHNVLIPDPCYYHFHNPNVVMELFYDFGSSSNNHPEPSLINLLVTISFGLIIGYYTFKFLNVR